MLLTPVVILYLFSLFDKTSADCNAYNGPAGNTECVKLSRYNGYQYATCLTDAYVKQKSNNVHQCQDQSRTYCYYQCMIEIHKLETGSIADDCSCDPNQPVPSPGTTLPTSCYSPNGQDCTWYRNCLEKRHPCETTSNDYALKYAENFCNLYGQSYSKFSSTGKQWVNDVRKCLQVSLVYLVRSKYATYSCSQIKQVAFSSHAPCYLKPWQSNPGICDLPLADYWTVFWTIKGSLITSDIGSTLSQIMDVAVGCRKKEWFPPSFTAVLQLRIEVKRVFGISKRSADLQLADEPSTIFAAQMTDSISTLMKWDAKTLDWFGYALNDTSIDPDKQLVVILLADKLLAQKKTNTSSVNLTTQSMKFGRAVADGSLPLTVNGTKLWITDLQLCTNTNCNTTTATFVSSENPHEPKRSCSEYCFYSLYLIMLCYVIALKTDQH